MNDYHNRLNFAVAAADDGTAHAAAADWKPTLLHQGIYGSVHCPCAFESFSSS
jgi:hypothetical protein